MKLEVGMYVRTIERIVKIEKILDGVMWDTQGHLHFGDFIKASHNIIDLIEVGDVIEFDITDIDNYADIQGYNCWKISCEEELNGVKEMIQMESAKLISIVTKEQFESMSYKVGE